MDSVLRRENIVVHYDSAVQSILGDTQVKTVVLENKKTGETQDLAVDGVFVAVGMVPDNAMFAPVQLDETGYIVAQEDCKTNVPGVFVAGDTRTKFLRQLVTAAADGAVAATQAANFLRI